MKATITQLAAYVGKSERTMTRWLASGKLPHKRLVGGLIEVDDSLLFPPDEQGESVLLATLQRIEQKLDDLAALVGTPSRIDSERARPSPVRHETQPIQGELPEGLMAWRDYCSEKGYPESSVKRWIDRGDIPVHHGKWKRGKVYILAAVDEEGKQAIDRLYGK